MTRRQEDEPARPSRALAGLKLPVLGLYGGDDARRAA